MKGKMMRKPHNEFVDFFQQIERMNKDRKHPRQEIPAPFMPRHQQNPQPFTRLEPKPANNTKLQGNAQSFNSKNRAVYEAFDTDKKTIASLADFKFLEDKLHYKGNVPHKVQLLQEIMLSDEPLISVEEV